MNNKKRMGVVPSSLLTGKNKKGSSERILRCGGEKRKSSLVTGFF